MKLSSETNPTISITTENGDSQNPATPQRRLIKVDLDALYGNDKDDDSDEDDGVQLKVVQNNDGSTCHYNRIFPEHTQSEPATPLKQSPDLPNRSRCRFMERRHTISNAQDNEHATMMITFPLEYTNNPTNVYNCLNGPSVSPILARRKQNLPRSMSKSLLQEEFFRSNQWQTAMGCLALNLEEVVHIRNVLTKAELESLPLDCNTKGDVESGKVCFLCLKARFSFFGPWAHGCKLCKRMVCAKCCSKMRIPTEHFTKIPVSSLSPMLSPTREEDSPIGTPGKIVSPVSEKSRGSVDSPTLISGDRKDSGHCVSPALSRISDGEISERRSISPEPESEATDISYSQSEGNSRRLSFSTVSSISLSLQALKRRGFPQTKESSNSNSSTSRVSSQLMVVCHDCKAMVLQIIKSSRAAKTRKDMRITAANLKLELHQHYLLK